MPEVRQCPALHRRDAIQDHGPVHVDWLSQVDCVKTCRYCQEEAPLLRFGDAGYPYQRDYGPTFVCAPCAAWVGCHPGTENALGGLANAELREAKQAAHAAFDPLWRRKIAKEDCSQSHARRAGYKWLSETTGIPFKKCHIGMMNLEECRKVVEVCTNLKQRTA